MLPRSALKLIILWSDREGSSCTFQSVMMFLACLFVNVMSIRLENPLVFIKVGEFPVFSTLSSRLLIRLKIILPLSVSL